MGLFEHLNDEVIDFLTEGVIDKVVENVDKVVENVDKVIGKVENRAEKKFNEYRRKMISKNPDNVHLWMQERHQTSGILVYRERSDYLFYDIDENLKYIAKGGKNNKLQRILLYDAKKCKIAELYEKMTAFRNPLSLQKEDHPVDYEIILHGKNLGKLCTDTLKGKQRIIVKFNGWKIEIKPFGKNQILDSSGNVIAEITSKVFNPGMISFLDFQNDIDEILVVISALAVRAYYKSYQRKSKYDGYTL